MGGFFACGVLRMVGGSFVDAFPLLLALVCCLCALRSEGGRGLSRIMYTFYSQYISSFNQVNNCQLTMAVSHKSAVTKEQTHQPKGRQGIRILFSFLLPLQTRFTRYSKVMPVARAKTETETERSDSRLFNRLCLISVISSSWLDSHRHPAIVYLMLAYVFSLSVPTPPVYEHHEYTR